MSGYHYQKESFGSGTANTPDVSKPESVPPKQWMQKFRDEIGWLMPGTMADVISGNLAEVYAPVAAAHAQELARLKDLLVTHGGYRAVSEIADQNSEAAESALTATKARIAALGDQMESDRTHVAAGVTAIAKAVEERHWLTEGRGPYEWNDDNWHDEFKSAAIEILDALKPLRKIAANWTDCPQTTEQVAQARIDLKAELTAAKADVEHFKKAYGRKIDECAELYKLIFANSEAVRRLCEAVRAYFGGSVYATTIAAALAEVEAAGKGE